MKQSPSIAEIFAANLKKAMGVGEWTQSSLSRASGVPQTTIGLYLHPGRRGGPTPKGKAAGPTMRHLVKLAAALKLQPWELLHPDPDRAHAEQAMYAKIEADFLIKKINSAPPNSSDSGKKSKV